MKLVMVLEVRLEFSKTKKKIEPEPNFWVLVQVLVFPPQKVASHQYHVNLIAGFHTHQRLDRDSHVYINWGNLQEEGKSQFEVCDGRWDCETWGYSYDCDSIMHYANDQYSTKKYEPTIGMYSYSYVHRFICKDLFMKNRSKDISVVLLSLL